MSAEAPAVPMASEQSLHSASCMAGQLLDGLARISDPPNMQMARGICMLVGSLKMAPAPAGITPGELIDAGTESVLEHLLACPLHRDQARAERLS